MQALFVSRQTKVKAHQVNEGAFSRPLVSLRQQQQFYFWALTQVHLTTWRAKLTKHARGVCTLHPWLR